MVGGCVPYCACGGWKTNCRVSSLPPPCGFCGSDSGCHPWWQAPSPAKPSCWPLTFFFFNYRQSRDTHIAKGCQLSTSYQQLVKIQRLASSSGPDAARGLLDVAYEVAYLFRSQVTLILLVQRATLCSVEAIWSHPLCLLQDHLCLSLAVRLKGFAFSVPSPDDTFPHTLLGLTPSHSLGVSSMSPTDH